MIKTDASPAEMGVAEAKLALLRSSIEKDIDDGLSDGSTLLVARRGRIVMHEAIGCVTKPGLGTSNSVRIWSSVYPGA